MYEPKPKADSNAFPNMKSLRMKSDIFFQNLLEVTMEPLHNFSSTLPPLISDHVTKLKNKSDIFDF